MGTKRRLALLGLAGAASVGAIVALASALPAQEKEKSDEKEAGERATVYARSFGFGSGSYLGVSLAEVDAEEAGRLGLGEPRGARITEVLEDTPAAEAGLEADDVILSWNGERVESAMELRRLVRETPPGRRVRIGVFRDGREREITATLGEREGPTAFGPGFRAPMAPRMDRLHDLRGRVERMRPGGGEFHVFVAGRGRLGVAMQSLGEQLGAYFGVEGGKGALIASVREDSPAGQAGLRAGDVIVRIGDQAVEEPGDAARAVRRAEAGPLAVEIVRDKRRQTVTVELPEPEEGDGTRWMESGRAFHFGVPELEIPAFEIEIPEIEMPELEIPAVRIPALEPERLFERLAAPEAAIVRSAPVSPVPPAAPAAPVSPAPPVAGGPVPPPAAV